MPPDQEGNEDAEGEGLLCRTDEVASNETPSSTSICVSRICLAVSWTASPRTEQRGHRAGPLAHCWKELSCKSTF